MINSNLLTVGADWRITNKLQSSIQREQNVGIADPTYPSETVLSAKYQVSPETKFFYTQRLSAAPIIPIGDISASGFASINTRSEMSLGMETRLERYTSLGSRYEIENGINGTDSYAVLGLVNRFPVSNHLSLDLGAEHGVRVSGKDHDFNSGTAAVSWLPNKFFRATTRYELRDQFGFGSLASAGAAGRISSGVTALGLLQIVGSNTNGQHNALNRAIAALAIRPLKSDRAGLLFSYNQQNGSGYSLLDGSSLPASVGVLSTDAWWQASKRLEFYDRLAFSDRTTSAVNAPGISTLTYMWQQRTQYRFGNTSMPRAKRAGYGNPSPPPAVRLLQQKSAAGCCATSAWPSATALDPHPKSRRIS
ncbi:MAG: hypothetical protein M3Y24_10525 [Acidobacteriota bacterium]|nr:hypothetical protein [Acidobacteriota bacterium]